MIFSMVPTARNPTGSLALPAAVGMLLVCAGTALAEDVQPLDRFLLDAVRDDRPLPRHQERSVKSQLETLALEAAVRQAARHQFAGFTRVAWNSLSAKDLLENPARFRGQPVELTGRLRRVGRLEPTPALLHTGVKDLYQVWFLNRSQGQWRLACVISPALPEGVAVGENVAAGRNVVAAGFFFKSLQVRQGDGVPGHPDRFAPLLVGRLEARLTGEVRAPLAASAVVLSALAGPTAPPALLAAGEPLACWTLRDPSRVPPLNAGTLRQVRDERPLPRLPEDLNRADPRDLAETEAYYEAIIKAHRTPAAAFLRAADPHVTYANLFNHPARHRGEVVRIDGRLRMVRREEPALMERQAGIGQHYEAWLFSERYGPSNPVCLVCTALPSGVPVSEAIDEDLRVTFIGYFFKKYRYKSVDSAGPNEWRDAPLLIGHIVVREKRPAEASSGSTFDAGPIFGIAVAAMILLVIVRRWSARRTPPAVRRRPHNRPRTEGEPGPLFFELEDQPQPARNGRGP